MKKYALALFLLAFASMAFPDDLIFDRMPNALGPEFSSFCATAIGYSRWFGNLGAGFSASFTYGPPSVYRSGGLYYGIIAKGMYRLLGSDFTKWLSSQLFVFCEGALFREEYPLSVLNLPSGYPYLGAAAGFGVESALFENFDFVFEAGYSAVFQNLTTIYQTPFIFQGALKFRF